MYDTLPLFHHQASFTQTIHKMNKFTSTYQIRSHRYHHPIIIIILKSSLFLIPSPPILLYLFISTKFLVQILKSQSKLDPIATPSSSSLLHHSLFAPFHLIEPPHPAKLPPFTSTLYGHQQRNLIDGSHLETVPGD